MHEALYKAYIFGHGQTLKTYDSSIKNTIDWLASYLRRSGGLKISLKSWICKDKLLNGFSLFSACLLKWHTWNSELGRSSRLEPLSFSPTVRKCNTSGTGGQQPTRNLSSDDMGQDLQPHTLTLTNTTSETAIVVEANFRCVICTLLIVCKITLAAIFKPLKLMDSNSNHTIVITTCTSFQFSS